MCCIVIVVNNDSWSNITGEDDPKLAQIKAERGYSYTDTCTVAPGQLPNYETKIQAFYEGSCCNFVFNILHLII